jgi:hypothetical protein
MLIHSTVVSKYSCCDVFSHITLHLYTCVLIILLSENVFSKANRKTFFSGDPRLLQVRCCFRQLEMTQRMKFS